MLNIDDRLIKEVLPIVGSDAFTIIQAISTFVNFRTKTAFPNVHTLRKMCPVEKNGELTPMPIARVRKAINRLIEANILERWQSTTERGDFGITKYRITTSYIRLYYGVDNYEFEGEDDSRVIEKRTTRKRNTSKRNALNDNTKYINNTKQINKIEQIKKEEVDPNFSSSNLLNNWIKQYNEFFCRVYGDEQLKQFELIEKQIGKYINALFDNNHIHRREIDDNLKTEYFQKLLYTVDTFEVNRGIKVVANNSFEILQRGGIY